MHRNSTCTARRCSIVKINKRPHPTILQVGYISYYKHLKRHHDAYVGAASGGPEERRHPGGVQALALPPQLLFETKIFLRVSTVRGYHQLFFRHRVDINSPELDRCKTTPVGDEGQPRGKGFSAKRKEGTSFQRQRCNSSYRQYQERWSFSAHEGSAFT